MPCVVGAASTLATRAAKVVTGHTFKPVSPFPIQRHLLMPLGNKPFENTVLKGEIARASNYSFSHSVFYPFG